MLLVLVLEAVDRVWIRNAESTNPKAYRLVQKIDKEQVIA